MGFLDLFFTKRVSKTPPPSSQKSSQNSSPVSDGNFFMIVENVYEIKGRGGVAVGKIKSGSIQKGTPVLVKGNTGEIQLVVAGIEMTKSKQDLASAGESVGLLLRGYDGSLRDFGIKSIESLNKKAEDIF